MRPSVFGIGVGKTGSNSLCHALRRLGFNSYHCGHETFHKNGDIHSQVTKNFNEGDDPLRGVDGIDALMDWPVFKMFRQIDHTAPGSKFILTYRNPDECAMSWCRMIAAQHERNKPWINPKNRSYNNYVKMTRDHNDAVLDHFFGRPEQLLVLDIKDDDTTKWRLLCKFLDRPMPDVQKYPREFDHKKWETKNE